MPGQWSEYYEFSSNIERLTGLGWVWVINQKAIPWSGADIQKGRQYCRSRTNAAMPFFFFFVIRVPIEDFARATFYRLFLC